MAGPECKKAVRAPSSSQQERQELGRAGEDAAADLLKRSGFRILARNWRKGSLELDLVCTEGDTLVFVEVRTRSAHGMVSPAESLGLSKRRSLAKAAAAYLAAMNAWNMPCRFDAVCIVARGANLEVEHLRHVFDLSEIMGRGHSSWQPW